MSDASADIVLLLGPLYHLVEREDRIAALREAKRILRPAGTVFAAGISRFAPAIDGIVEDLIADPVFRRIVERDLTDGQHRNPTLNPRYFTTAYFHRPEDLLRETEEAGSRKPESSASKASAGRWRISTRSWPTPQLAIVCSTYCAVSKLSLLCSGPARTFWLWPATDDSACPGFFVTPHR